MTVSQSAYIVERRRTDGHRTLDQYFAVRFCSAFGHSAPQNAPDALGDSFAEAVRRPTATG